MKKKIYLFPDTNLFIQCKALSELDWSAWNSFDEVCLLVSRPVQAEIDKHKNMGNKRLADRSRKASAKFREILLSEYGYETIRDKGPQVKIFLRQDVKYDESLCDKLSYEERDDQLVGIASQFTKSDPDGDVAILTHDTGPMISAKMVGVAFFQIPESWLLPPETDDAEKSIKALQAELLRLKKAEPSIEVKIDGAQPEGGRLELEIQVFDPLSQGEISGLMDHLKRLFPIETHFGSKYQEEKKPTLPFSPLSGMKVFVPASDEEISEYADIKYPEWLQDCESLLQGIHEKLNSNVSWPVVNVWMKNIGPRPADDALITFSSGGNFQIKAPDPEIDVDDEQSESGLIFPGPPAAPKGYWKEKIPGLTNRLLWEKPNAHARHIEYINNVLSPLNVPKHNPNGFYYHKRPKYPVQSFSLTCDQWRHQSDDEIFEVLTHVDIALGVTEGALEVKVQAANMSDAVVKLQPLRITVSKVNALEEVEELIKQQFGLTSRR